jgi:hypothetical protein
MLAKPQAVLEDTKLILTLLALQMLIFCGDFVLKIRWQYDSVHMINPTQEIENILCHVSPYKNKFKKNHLVIFYGAWSPNWIPGVTTKASGRC